jgi:hypothetical protein
VSLSAFVLVDAILLIGNHTISEYLHCWSSMNLCPILPIERFSRLEAWMVYSHVTATGETETVTVR